MRLETTGSPPSLKLTGLFSLRVLVFYGSIVLIPVIRVSTEPLTPIGVSSVSGSVFTIESFCIVQYGINSIERIVE